MSDGDSGGASMVTVPILSVRYALTSVVPGLVYPLYDNDEVWTLRFAAAPVTTCGLKDQEVQIADP